MKKLLFALLLIATPCFAADEPEKAPPPNSFESFLVEKARFYSGKTEDALGKALDVAQEEVPETMRQFLVWRSWKHLITFLTPLTLTVIGILTFAKMYKKADFDSENFPAILTIIIGILTIFTTIAMGYCFSHLLSFIEIQVAPRIYIIEELSKWLK